MIRRNKVLYNDSAADTGDWIRLDSRYEIDPTRALTIHMNAADTITLEGTVVDAKDAAALEAKIVDQDIVVLEEYTGEAEVNQILSGNYTFIRASKTGTAGNAKVQGYV